MSVASPGIQPGTSHGPPPAALPWGKTVLLLLLAFILALKGIDLGRRVYNSDEPQHMHVAWGWTQGQVQYRDYFDNHTPLFHLLMAPLVGRMEGQPDALLLGRLAVLPFWLMAAAAVGWLAARLYSRRAGVFAALLALACPPLLIVGTEFRADVLWTALWLLTVFMAAGGAFTRSRAFLTGLLFGLTVLASAKSFLLALSFGAAVGTGFLLLDGPRRREFFSGGIVKLLCIGAGFCIPAAALVLFLDHHQALPGFFHCLFQHSTGIPVVQRQALRPWRGAGVLVALAAALWFRRATVLKRTPEEWGLSLRRLLVLLIPLYYYIFHLLLSGKLPLGARQDYLPCLPLLAVPVAGWIALQPAARSMVLLALAVLAEGGYTGLMKPRFHRQSYDALSRDIRALAQPGEPVMDPKGEAIFHRRPFFFCLETVTSRKLRGGLLPNTIAQDIAATETRICILPERYPLETFRWVRRYFVPLNANVWVAGCQVPAGEPGTNRPFETAIPAEYQLVAPGGTPVAATVDGTASNGPVFLAPGRHALQCADARPLQLVWARAIQKGYRPSTAPGQ